MAKETFDQVSATMWGHNTLDYEKNYINPRDSWSDFVIREEALYYEGRVSGLRLGASQRLIQSTSLGGLPTLPFGASAFPYNWNDWNPLDPIPMGYYSSGKFGDGYNSHRSTPGPEPDVHSSVVFPSHETPKMDIGFHDQQHALDVQFSAYPWNDRGSTPEPEPDVRPGVGIPSRETPKKGQHASDVTFQRSSQWIREYQMHQAQQQAAMQDQQERTPMAVITSLPNTEYDPAVGGAGIDFHARSQAQQQHLRRDQQQEYHMAHQEQSQMISPWTFMAPTIMELPPLQNGTAPQMTPYKANTQQTANPTAIQAQVPGLAEPSGGLLASNGEAPSTPALDNQVSYPRTAEVLYSWTFPSPAAGPHRTNALNTTVEHVHDDLSDEAYYKIANIAYSWAFD